MISRSVLPPLIWFQFAITVLLTLAIGGRIIEIWEGHISVDELAHAATQLTLRAWVPVVLLIGLVFALVNLLRGGLNQGRTGGNILWPMLATLFAYFAANYWLVGFVIVDGMLDIAQAKLPAEDSESYVYLAYKAEIPVFCNLAPEWMSVWAGAVASSVAFLASTVCYWVEGNRGDLLDDEQEQEAFEKAESAS